MKFIRSLRRAVNAGVRYIARVQGVNRKDGGPGERERAQEVRSNAASGMGTEQCVGRLKEKRAREREEWGGKPGEPNKNDGKRERKGTVEIIARRWNGTERNV